MEVDARQIVDYIESFQILALERPDWCAPNPCALEAVLIELEDVREFALTGLPREKRTPSHYARFLEAHGCGVGLFTFNRLRDRPKISEHELFTEVAAFWREFRRSAHRFQE